MSWTYRQNKSRFISAARRRVLGPSPWEKTYRIQEFDGFGGKKGARVVPKKR